MKSETKDIKSNKIKSQKELLNNKKNQKNSKIHNSSDRKNKLNSNKNSTKKNSVNKANKVKNTSTKKSVLKKESANNKINAISVVEYYDLPYRYNETIVKILYQTPNTLFVYWDISDKDRENYIKQYGENFFNNTRPVLVIHNDTMNYTFEVPINDFANSWYLNINDTKCNYRIELGRRPINSNSEKIIEKESNISKDYIYITSSNKIEMPNDHILFTTNENNTIKFRNIKNNVENSVSLFDIIAPLPDFKNFSNNHSESPSILQKVYNNLYQNEDVLLYNKISNPSSSNASSGSVPVRIS